MEFVPGVPLNQYCDAARLTVQQRLRLFLKICAAVAPITRRSFTGI